MNVEMIRREACALAKKLHRERGIPMPVACRMATRAVFRVLGRTPGGMGQSIVDPILRPDIEAVDAREEAVRRTSPILWVLSILSLGLTILNTSRISEAYRSWKRRGNREARRALRAMK